MSRTPTTQSDAELLTAVRGGDDAAYRTLYERHRGAALVLARQICRRPSDAEDAVSDAFTRVLGALRSGKGPDVAFRPYLLTAVRRQSWRRSAGREDPAPEDDDFDRLLDPVVDDPADREDRRLVLAAFQALPERWRLVLWHTEVEDASPAEVATLLGVKANAVAALAYRAREGLRRAYLQAHLQHRADSTCAGYVEQLGADVRDGLSAREKGRLESHLAECETCRGLRDELVHINTGMHSILGPAVLGTALTGYLADVGAASTTSTASAVTGLDAATSSGGPPAPGRPGSNPSAAGKAAEKAGPEKNVIRKSSGRRALVAGVLVVLVLLGATYAVARGGGDADDSVNAGEPTDSSDRETVGGVDASPGGDDTTATTTSTASTTTTIDVDSPTTGPPAGPNTAPTPAGALPGAPPTSSPPPSSTPRPTLPTLPVLSGPGSPSSAPESPAPAPTLPPTGVRSDLAVNLGVLPSTITTTSQGFAAIQVFNNGPADRVASASDPVRVIVTFESPLDPSSLDAPGWSCGPVAPTTTCDWTAPLPYGGAPPAPIEIGLSADTPDPAAVITAVVAGGSHDPDPGNDTATVTLPVA